MPDQKYQITSMRSPNPGPQQAEQAIVALLSLSRIQGPGRLPRVRAIGEISTTSISWTIRDLPRRDEATELGFARSMGVGEKSSDQEDNGGFHVADCFDTRRCMQLQTLEEETKRDK